MIKNQKTINLMYSNMVIKIAGKVKKNWILQITKIRFVTEQIQKNVLN